MPHQVFICHSSKDKLVADAACAALEAQRIPCWIAPRDVLGGTEYMEELDNALSDCQIVLLIFSQAANDSPQVRREIERAVSYEKIILPFRIEDILPTRAMKFALSNTHWLDALTPPMEHRLKDLCQTVSRLIQRKKGTRPLWQPTEPATEWVTPTQRVAQRILDPDAIPQQPKPDTPTDRNDPGREGSGVPANSKKPALLKMALKVGLLFNAILSAIPTLLSLYLLTTSAQPRADVDSDLIRGIVFICGSLCLSLFFIALYRAITVAGSRSFLKLAAYASSCFTLIGFGGVVFAHDGWELSFKLIRLLPLLLILLFTLSVAVLRKETAIGRSAMILGLTMAVLGPLLRFFYYQFNPVFLFLELEFAALLFIYSKNREVFPLIANALEGGRT